MNNSIQMIKNIINSSNPQEIINKMAGNNAILLDLITKAKNGDTNSIENFARNLFKENGRDFDKEFAQFMSNFKK
jgi:predicted metalloprotease with PDZ domain